MRHDDDGQGIVCEVKPHVLVNHWGTILSKKEISMEESGSYYPSEDLDYSGELVMVDEYLRLYVQGSRIEEGNKENGMQPEL